MIRKAEPEKESFLSLSSNNLELWHVLTLMGVIYFLLNCHQLLRQLPLFEYSVNDTFFYKRPISPFVSEKNDLQRLLK